MAAYWTNWLGNQTARPQTLHEPTDIAGVVAAVEQANTRNAPMRIVSGSYCWSPLAPSQSTMLNMRQIKRIRHVDHAKCQITVETGAPIRDVVLEAQKHGMSVRSPSMFLGLTLGGLIATGSHGTGRHTSTIGDTVVGFELVRPDGTVQQVSEPGSELWRAVITSLGALGVVTAVTLQCEPMYNVRESHIQVPYQEAASLIPAMLRDYEFVSVFWAPAGPIANFKLGERTEEPATPLRGRMFPTPLDQTNRWAGFYLPRMIDRVPSLTPVMAALVTRGIGMGSQVVSEPDFSHYQQVYPPVISSEFAVPVERASEAWAWIVQRLMQYWQSGIRPVDMVVHARFGKASDALLSSAAGRASCFIELLCVQGNRHRELFAVEYDAKMRTEFQGRPHWGKDLARPECAAACWGDNVEAFLDIRQELDPKQLFLNPFLRDEVFGLGRRVARLSQAA